MKDEEVLICMNCFIDVIVFCNDIFVFLDLIIIDNCDFNLMIIVEEVLI